MFSVIIPTLQKDNKILSLLLDELCLSNVVEEIILIDNSTKGFEYNSTKVKTIIPKENLFVNPAWNLGVKKAKNDYVAILNDDIIFPKNFFNQVYDFILENKKCGLIGLDSILKSKKEDIVICPEKSETLIYPLEYRCNCWGSAIFGRKEHFYKIPDNLKIWCGDDYLFKLNIDKGFTNYKIVNSDIKHIHSLSCGSPEFLKIMQNDVQEYLKIDKGLLTGTLKSRKYDLFVSLGGGCNCTQVLRKSGLQYWSYPFDWLFGSSFLDRIKILAQNFANFIDKEDLEYVVLPEKYASVRPNDVYKNKKNGIVFNHDFKRGVLLDETYDYVKEKYERRINRLLNQIENSKNVLFVYIGTVDDRREVLKTELLEGYKILKNKFRETEIDILYIFNEREVSYSSKKVINITNNITRVSFDFDAYNTDIPWMVNEEPLLSLFKNYKISCKHMQFKNILEKIKNDIIHFLQIMLSVKNEYRNNTKRKIIYILGLKITFKKGIKNEMEK